MCLYHTRWLNFDTFMAECNSLFLILGCIRFRNCCFILCFDVISKRHTLWNEVLVTYMGIKDIET